MQSYGIMSKDQIISLANKAAVDAVNTSLKLQAPVQVDPMKGDVLDGFPSINYKELTNKVTM